LQRVRVQLDWDRGEVSFSDPSDNTPLYTFKHSFTERVFPFFNNGSLQICPLKVSVRVEQCCGIVWKDLVKRYGRGDCEMSQPIDF
ncbi:hypothetical protein ANANG_G00131380, partial [Anguilla anguilla]